MDRCEMETHWTVGERLLIDDGKRDVTVEDTCADHVCCRWQQDGLVRRSWIAGARLRRIAHPLAASADS